MRIEANRVRGRGLRSAAAAAAAVALLAQAGPAAAQTGEAGLPEVRALLDRAESVYDGLASLQADFEQTIEVPLLGRSRTGRGIWYHKGRGRFKMDFTDPAGDQIVADGTHVWLYYPSTHPGQVIRSAIEANATGAGMLDLQGRIFEEADERYAATLEGRVDVGGMPTFLVHLTPLGESPYRRVRVWIHTADHLVRKFEITEENETVRTVILRNLQPNHSVPDSVFRFVPPPGTDVFEG